MKNIKGAIFDMDGTLIDSLMLWEMFWDEFGKKYLNGAKFLPDEKDDKAIRTLTLKNSMEYIHNIYKIGESGKELLDEVNRIMENFYANEVKLKEGVMEFLSHCRAEGIKMCIASASDTGFIKLALKHCGIEDYFIDVVSCVESGKGKDSPDVFLMALQILGTEIENTCVFEDSLVALKTADKIGMKTVGIFDKYNYGHDEMKEIADFYIGEGESLMKLVDAGV